ncbi:MAG: hypothetical protein J5710_14175 [Treponema sp.]|nr:hypothetical protein [Treponema sp.]
MSLQDSTFNTAHVQDNEIVKANDFEFAFESLITNVSKSTQMFLESNQDFVINGKVLPYQGMNVEISPIFGVCKSTGVPFGRTETATMEYGFEESTSGRVDIIEVQGDWETYDNQQRAFNDPDTDTQTYQYVDTKKLMKPVYRIKKGVEGGSTAPEVDDGWVKLAEVVIRPNNSTILATDIKNITSDVASEDNEDWTTEPDITYNIGYISDVNARFREQHNADGTHKDDVINSDSLDIGTGAKQINGNILPVGGSVSIPNETIAATDSILSVIVKAAAMLTSLYNAYLKFSSSGIYGFNGDLQISSLLDANEDLVKPISISAAGDGTAVIKVDGNAVLSIDANGKLSTNGYTASSNDHIVTKVVTDGLKSLIDALDTRVTNIENLSDPSGFANGVLSSGTTGRYNPDNTQIYAATTANVTLSGSQTIDGTTPTNGSYILVKNQTNPKENGIYQYASSSAWTRVTAFATPASMKGKLFSISAGTNNGNKMFYMTNWNFTDGTAFGSDDIEILEYFGAMKAVANKVIMRDANGRAKVAAPSESDDIARKAEIDALYSTTVKGTDLGTAAVGSCTTFARSDHVHPWACCTCMDWFCGAADRPVVLTTANNTLCCWQLATLGPAVYCKFTFNPNTGVVKAPTFCGAFCGNASTATKACCASCNGSGTAFGAAAVCGTVAGGSVTYVDYSGTNGCRLMTSNFLAYWNGAYSSAGASNLRYYCGGAFGTAAACAATAFRSCTWWPNNLTQGCVNCAQNACWACTTKGGAYFACYMQTWEFCIGKTCCYNSNLKVCFCYTTESCGTMKVYNCSYFPMLAAGRHVVNNTWLCQGGMIGPGCGLTLGTYWNCCSGTTGCEIVTIVRFVENA